MKTGDRERIDFIVIGRMHACLLCSHLLARVATVAFVRLISLIKLVFFVGQITDFHRKAFFKTLQHNAQFGERDIDRIISILMSLT